MRVYYCIAALWMSLVVWARLGSYNEIWNAIGGISHGVLVKDGFPTNCGLAFIDANACAVAASCLNHTADGLVDKGIAYDVFLSNVTIVEATSSRVTSITVHPKYNPLNHINDIAVLEFDTLAQGVLGLGMCLFSIDQWNKTLFAQRYLVNHDRQEWSELAFSMYTPAASDRCIQLSQVYENNQDYMICSDNTPASNLSRNTLHCPLPVGVVYGVADNTLCRIGLYSYTVLDGDLDICSAKTHRVYYTALYPYGSFFKETLGRPFITTGESTDYTMPNKFDRDAKNDYISVGYDFVGRLGAQPEPESDMLTEVESDWEGMPHQTIIAIAVCVPVIVLLLLAIGLWLFCKRRIRHRHDNMVSPVVSDDYQDMLVVEQPQAETPALITEPTNSATSTAQLVPSTSQTNLGPGAYHASANGLSLGNISDTDDQPPMYSDVVASSSSATAGSKALLDRLARISLKDKK